MHSRPPSWKPLLRWLPALVMMGVIFFASSLTSAEVPHFEGVLDFIVKKGGHMTGYALLSSAYLFGLGRLSRRSFLAAWVMAVLYGFSDELHQTYSSGRTPTLMDVGFDSLGAAMGLLIYSLTLRFRTSPHPPL